MPTPTHLRIVIRQHAGAVSGGKSFALNDGVEVVDSETGQIIGDLSNYVRRIEIIDDVGSARMVRLEMFAGEIAAETEPERSPPRSMPHMTRLYDQERE
jgi:hypothetical protein